MEDAGPGLRLDLIICTYNNASGLAAVLAAIGALRTPPGLRWSVLVVDNASTDETPAVARRFAERLVCEVRYVREAEQGLTPARRRGVVETTGEWVAFVDDDNLLDPDWLAAVAAAIRAHPRAGGVGGRVRLDWAGGRPRWAGEFGFCFAEQELGPQPRRVESLVGAGMALKRQALIDCGWVERPLLADRIGRSLVSGGDAEMALRVARAGYELWYAPEALMRHRMPPARASCRYLWRINHALGAATVLMSRLAWLGDPAGWAEAQRRETTRRLAEAWRGLGWSLAHRQKLIEAIAWLCLALGLRRGLAQAGRLASRSYAATTWGAGSDGGRPGVREGGAMIWTSAAPTASSE